MKGMFDLTGKVAIVIGGNGRLGKQFCRSLHSYGAKVYCCDIKIDDAIHKMDSEPERYVTVKLDATKKEELVAFRERIKKNDGRLDILVNSTTMKGKDFYLPFEDVSLESWDIGILGNLTMPFLAIQAFAPLMVEQKNGSIINISSHYGMVGNDQRIYEGSNLDEVYVDSKEPAKKRLYSHGVYNAAKGGLINFTRYLAAYYGHNNIRVNCISPGGIHNPDENKEFLRRYSEKVPLGRKAHEHEVNGAVVFLASDASTYITGHNLVIDGGYTIW